MKIDAGLDTGDILLQRRMGIEDDDTSETLAPRLAQHGAELLVETMHGLRSGVITPRPQNESQATLARLLKKEDGLMDFNRTAHEIRNRMRGFQPWPGAFTTFRNRLLHIWSASAETGNLRPGEIAVSGDSFRIGCGSGTALLPLQLQPEGKKRVMARDFVHGYHPRAGEILGG